MDKEKITLEQYNLLLKAFRGGNTHANRYKVGRIISNVTSYDFASSYPAVMICSDQFPSGRLMECTNSVQTPDGIDYYIKNYWCIFEAVLRMFS